MAKEVQKLLATFAEKTSAHGLLHIHDSRYRWLKLTWALLYGAAAIYAIFQMSSLFKLYFDYPTKVTLELNSKNSLPFPSVTVCRKEVQMKVPKKVNQTDILSSASRMEHLINIFQEMKNSGRLPDELANKLPQPLFHRVIKRGILDELSLPGGSSMLPQPSSPGSESGPAPLAEVSSAEQPISSEQTEGDRNSDNDSVSNKEQARQCNEIAEFILKCSFNGVPCNDSRDFTESLHPKNCVCKTYNLAIDTNRKPVDNNLSGGESGLKLKVFMNPVPLDIMYRETPGVEVFIGHPGEHQYLTNVRLIAEGGHQTSVQMVKKQHISDPLVSDCSEQQENSVFKGRYTTQACKLEGRISLMVKNCQCIATALRYQDVISKYPDVPACGGSEEIIQCLNNVVTNATSFGCKVPCVRNLFDVVVNTFEWPSSYDTMLRDVVATVEEVTDNPALQLLYEQGYLLINATGHLFPEIPLITEMLKEMIANAFFKDIFVEMNLYYKDLIEEVYKLERSYDFENFLGDIGGHLGLWLGFSVLTICECVQLLVALCALCCRCRPRDRDITGASAYHTNRDETNQPSKMASYSASKSYSQYDGHVTKPDKYDSAQLNRKMQNITPLPSSVQIYY